MSATLMKGVRNTSEVVVPITPTKKHFSIAKKTSGIAGQKGKIFVGSKLYKPIRDGTQEEEFYESIQNSSSELAKLKKYVPCFHGVEEVDGQKYLSLKNLLYDCKNPALIEIKIGITPHRGPLTNTQRLGVGNLLGCYVEGVEAMGLIFHNKMNGYIGRDTPIDVFHKQMKQFLRKMGPSMDLIRNLYDLIQDVKSLKGHRLNHSSIVIIFDEDIESPRPPSMHLIDFERYEYIHDNDQYDAPVVTAMKHVLYEMRLAWEKTRPPTVYLVRHGERQDYTDVNWAPNSTHPHDAPLSDAGETQANDIAERLAFAKPHMMASSPFQRAIMCLEPLARRLKQKMCVEPGLCEFLCSQTRTKVPGFIAEAVTVTPYVSTKYQPFWPNLKLETWEEVIARTKETTLHLLDECYGWGDLIIVSHRSTLQSVFAAIAPDYEKDTKLEYGAIAMLVEDPFTKGKWDVQSFNELNHLENRISSPSSNPWRHIEGYYEDLSWSHIKNISSHISGPVKLVKADSLPVETVQLVN